MGKNSDYSLHSLFLSPWVHSFYYVFVSNLHLGVLALQTFWGQVTGVGYYHVRVIYFGLLRVTKKLRLLLKKEECLSNVLRVCLSTLYHYQILYPESGKTLPRVDGQTSYRREGGLLLCGQHYLGGGGAVCEKFHTGYRFGRRFMDTTFPWLDGMYQPACWWTTAGVLNKLDVAREKSVANSPLPSRVTNHQAWGWIVLLYSPYSNKVVCVGVLETFSPTISV